MSIGEEWQPPRICPECNHKSGANPCATCKPYGRPCTWCLHSGPVPVDIAVPPTPEIVTTESVGMDDLPEYRLPQVDVTEIYGQRIEDRGGVLCVAMRDARGNDCFFMPLPSTFTRGDAMAIAEMHQRGVERQEAAKRIARMVRGQS